MKKLIEKIDATSNLDEKIRLLKSLSRIVNTYLRFYKKQKSDGK